jgi:hypothetical protein
MFSSLLHTTVATNTEHETTIKEAEENYIISCVLSHAGPAVATNNRHKDTKKEEVDYYLVE